jgi:hypothetical protein
MLTVLTPIFYHLLSRIFYTNLYIDLSFSQPMFFLILSFCKFISRFEAEPVLFYLFIYLFLFFIFLSV